MEDVIIISSDESDEELLPDAPPLSDVRVDIKTVNATMPPNYIDLTEPRWAFPQLKCCKPPVIDLTEDHPQRGLDRERRATEMHAKKTATEVHKEKTATEVDTKNVSVDCATQTQEESVNDILNNQDSNLPESLLRDSHDFAPQQDCGIHIAKRRKLNSPIKHKEAKQSAVPCLDKLAVKLSRLPFLESNAIQMRASGYSVHLGESSSQMSLCFNKVNINTEARECNSEFGTRAASNVSHVEPSFVQCLPEVAKSAIGQNGKELASENVQKKESPPRQSPVDSLCSEEQCPTQAIETECPISTSLQEECEGDETILSTDVFRAVSREDRQFLCPVELKKVMAKALADEDDESFGNPEVFCRKSLSLLYITIDVNYPEGTLQLLSDLLQPGYYPPKDVLAHLLNGILLDPQCPHHLCEQASNLLMKNQRHHMATKSTIPWDWELLTSVMSSEIRCEAVLLFLEYVVQTLEDDFQAKRSTSALHQSIAKTTLSCDQQFPRVRDVIKWLFSAIMKSTEPGEGKETSRDRDDQLSLVFIFQRMLFLALEVDRSPALNCGKLAQELFHMLLSHAPLRAYRMLLLEGLQSKLLRCKLLELLLDYACPQKISVPTSLSLLLHFLKHCTLAPDPTDDTKRSNKWEELIQLIWMLLCSYNTAMKGYLFNSNTEQRRKVGTLVYKPEDKISKSGVQEAVEAFMSRSQMDLGQALPDDVQESLTYLQDHLLDACQC
ncbi:SUMO-interacting motif-containing protein 1 isoform X2 [Cololabis saira]|uniref:SUMO-interacting motif-containing protein 1 isoform X2 n=1 Tax=Cololabis saira TaxID=129043 RepID=UPI002AD471DB|nr:SUMO-interacting motif-containing protein 1 isoform X2 [Cololabis saira]